MDTTPKSTALLPGYRVLDLTSSMGALCGKLLADLGMDVVKVEPPGGDPARCEPPFAKGHQGTEASLRFAYLNAGKRSITLDINEKRGRDLLLDLVGRADIVLETFEPGFLAAHGLSYSDLIERQKQLILVSLTGFGQEGPYAHFKTPDLVGTAMGGLLYISGDPHLTPCNPPETQSYYYGSLFAAYGVMLALWQRETRGIGVYIDASIQASMALHEHVAFNYAAEGRVMKRAGSQHQHNAPANLFKCKNGYIALFVTQTHWPLLLKVWDDHAPELDDPKWINSNLRRAQADYINAEVTSFTSRFLKEDLAELMQQHGIPGLPVNSPADFMKDPHIQARGFFGRVTHPVLGSFVQAGSPFMVNGQRRAPSPAPLLGQHNRDVLCGEMGLGDAEMESLTRLDAKRLAKSNSESAQGAETGPGRRSMRTPKTMRANANSTNQILNGVRILTFTTGYAGPFAGRLLASYGAEVIKIESRNGGLDTFRHYGQHKDIDAAPRFIECNLGVRSLSVNLKHPTGQRLIKELAAKSDAILQNFRPRVLDKLGLGDDELRKSNVKLAILKLPGFGSQGPKSGYGTWGFNLTAFSGMTYLWNHPEQDRPIGSQGVYPDHLGFIMAPTLLVAALLHSRRTGKGVTVDLAQIEGTAYTLGTTYLEVSVNGDDPKPRGNRYTEAAPHGCYRCRGDDRWCVISVNEDEQWRSLCAVIDRTDLAGDSRFADSCARHQNVAELDAIVQQWTETQSAEDVMNRLQSAGVAAGIAQTGADLLKDPQLRQRNYFASFADSLIGPFEIPRSGFLFKGMAEDCLRLPNRFGSDNDQILGDLLGYDKMTTDQWRGEGVLT